MDYYDQIANGYDELHGAEQLLKLSKISGFLKMQDYLIQEDWSLLDVGCGSGISTAFFNCKTKKGIDPSEELIKEAKRKFPHIDFSVDTAEDFDTPLMYDLVVSLTAMQNFTDLEKGIKNMQESGRNHIFSVLKRSPKIGKIRSILEDYTEIEINQDIVFVKFFDN